jgi:hypothetical protein
MPRKSRKAGPKEAPKRWIAVYYRTADGTSPARDALFAPDFPANVRLALLARAAAIRDTPPPAFPASSPMWSVMTRDRERGNVDMSGIFEIRDRQGDTLYRVFCVVDSGAESHGLEAPALVLLSVGVKQVRTAMPQAVYREVRSHADRYLATSPRPVALPPDI